MSTSTPTVVYGVNNVSKSFPGVKALKNVSIEIHTRLSPWRDELEAHSARFQSAKRVDEFRQVRKLQLGAVRKPSKRNTFAFPQKLDSFENARTRVVDGIRA